MELQFNCGNCGSFDGAFCTLPTEEKLVRSYIDQPERVVCAEWVKPEPEEEITGEPV